MKEQMLNNMEVQQPNKALAEQGSTSFLVKWSLDDVKEEELKEEIKAKAGNSMGASEGSKMEQNFKSDMDVKEFANKDPQKQNIAYVKGDHNNIYIGGKQNIHPK